MGPWVKKPEFTIVLHEWTPGVRCLAGWHSGPLAALTGRESIKLDVDAGEKVPKTTR